MKRGAEEERASMYLPQPLRTKNQLAPDADFIAERLPITPLFLLPGLLHRMRCLQWSKKREVWAGTEKSVSHEALGGCSGSSAPRAVPSQPVQSQREIK